MPYPATAAGERVGQLNDILHSLEPLLGPCSGTPAPLQGGITNRNFQVTLGGAEYVVRQHGARTELLGIDRASERLAAETASGLGIGPRVAATLPDAMATEFVVADELSAREVSENIEQIAGSLRAFHDSGAHLPSTFDVPGLLADYARIARESGGELPAGYDELVALARRIVHTLPAQPPRPCHNDLLAGNLLRARDGHIVIVDWEYAGMGDTRFDLGNLAVNNDFDDADDERLLSSYHRAGPSDAQRAGLKLARVLSDIRETAWGVLQSAVSELDFDFDGYGREHYERLLAAAAQPSFEEWLVAAAG